MSAADAVAAKESEHGFEKSRRGPIGLIRHQTRESQPGMVVDGDVEVFPACARDSASDGLP